MNEDQFPQIAKCTEFGRLMVYRDFGDFSAIVQVGDEPWLNAFGSGETILEAIENLEKNLAERSAQEFIHEPLP